MRAAKQAPDRDTGKTPGGPAFPPANLLQHPYLPALRRIPAPGFPSLALDLLAPLPLRRFATAVVAAARRCHARCRRSPRHRSFFSRPSATSPPLVIISPSANSPSCTATTGANAAGVDTLPAGGTAMVSATRTAPTVRKRYGVATAAGDKRGKAGGGCQSRSFQGKASHRPFDVSR